MPCDREINSLTTIGEQQYKVHWWHDSIQDAVRKGKLISSVHHRELLLRSFDGLPVLSEVASSLFGVVIVSVSRPREAGVALDFCWPLVDSSRDGGLRVPFGEAVAVALADAVAIADAVAVGEAAALGETVP